MAKVYDNIQELNKMIEKTVIFENACDYIFKHYHNINEVYPSIEFLRREYKRMGKWLYQDTEHIQHVEQLRLSLQYLRDITREVYMIDWRNE